LQFSGNLRTDSEPGDGEEQVKVGKTNIAQWLVRITCAIALLFVGFAHQSPVLANGAVISSEFQEYVLPDGTLPVICIASKVEGKHTHEQAHAVKCEACRVSASVLVPVPGSGGGERLRIEANHVRPAQGVGFHGQLFPHSRGARAPPGNLVFA
jgi:hypothetical protein